jgi:hypothetical protein
MYIDGQNGRLLHLSLLERKLVYIGRLARLAEPTPPLAIVLFDQSTAPNLDESPLQTKIDAAEEAYENTPKNPGT